MLITSKNNFKHKFINNSRKCEYLTNLPKSEFRRKYSMTFYFDFKMTFLGWAPSKNTFVIVSVTIWDPIVQ